MNLEALKAAMQWLAIGQQVIASGAAAMATVKAALAAHGIDADTSALDAVIVDGERRAAAARVEAELNARHPVQPASAAALGITTGSTGE